MRTLVVGDIHGKYDLFIRLLEEMEYSPGADRLVLIGDLVDRGENSSAVVTKAMELKKADPDNVVILRGNHEAMMINALAQPSGEDVELWYINGGIETLQSYLNDEGELDIPEDHYEFLYRLPTWFEDDHAIYVHAGLIEDEEGKFLHPQEEPDHPALLWSRSRHFFAEYTGKTVIFGHTITGMLFGEREKVWLRDHVIGVDTGAYLTGVLSGIEMPSRQIFSVREESEDDENSAKNWLRKKLWS
jgi:serine/threonine protein phosphatase 1